MQTIDAKVSSKSVNPFEANWSSKGHTLCLGHWIITYRGGLLILPKLVGEDHMDTYGIFSWLFPDDEDYAEGLMLDDWISEKADWLINLFEQNNITFNEETVQWFYEAVNKSDWRCGSCGGCL